MDSELLKRLTGGEEIVARQLHKKTISFKPTFTLAVVANEAPTFDDQSEGLWRRIVVIPFNVRIADSERIDAITVGQLLEEEAEGILAWCVEGYRMYARDGFSAPDSITMASALMRDQQDYIRVFLRENTIEDEDCVLKAPDLYAAYLEWQRDEPEAPKPGSNKFYAKVDAIFGDRKVVRIAGRQQKGWPNRRLRNGSDDESVNELTLLGSSVPYSEEMVTTSPKNREVNTKALTPFTPNTESNTPLQIVTPIFGEDV
jgi:phage/plasmid-associated DNA primase